jgi:hypothetical protein
MMTRTGGPDPRSAHFSLVLFVSDNRLDWQSYSIAAAAPATDYESQHAGSYRNTGCNSGVYQVQNVSTSWPEYLTCRHYGLNVQTALVILLCEFGNVDVCENECVRSERLPVCVWECRATQGMFSVCCVAALRILNKNTSVYHQYIRYLSTLGRKETNTCCSKMYLNRSSSLKTFFLKGH